MTDKYSVNEIIRGSMPVPPVIGEAVNRVADSGRIARQGELVEWFENSVAMVLSSSSGDLGRFTGVRDDNGRGLVFEFRNATVKAQPIMMPVSNVIHSFRFSGANPFDGERHEGIANMNAEVLNLIVYPDPDAMVKTIDYGFLARQFDDAVKRHGMALDASEEARRQQEAKKAEGNGD